MSEAVKIKRGVRQGCVLSPAIFNLYTEYIFRTIDNIYGLTVGGININNLRYADDTVMLAENEDDLQKLVNTVKEESEKCGLFINIRKTQTMLGMEINPHGRIFVKSENHCKEAKDQ
ncbi:retrovirus-related Pol polyprotein from type-1 retrotransposable element R2 [Elysia marginata]|uniref:Retrovirus-related Pol polyprotein from type-1 retrotransposable element R2 n=1 Tax=Elysia marginata TaxID=1093978 RepID=A0AAV4IN42_9GAST|nr:retrovirus-related Pol polyprotein from type-1 retrotransposable element R2 [Elysia marginata]